MSTKINPLNGCTSDASVDELIAAFRNYSALLADSLQKPRQPATNKPGILYGYDRSPDGLYRKVVHMPYSAFIGDKTEIKWTAKVLVRNSTGKLIKVEKNKQTSNP